MNQFQDRIDDLNNHINEQMLRLLNAQQAMRVILQETQQ